jgi:hypothetical protein
LRECHSILMLTFIWVMVKTKQIRSVNKKRYFERHKSSKMKVWSSLLMISIMWKWTL